MVQLDWIHYVYLTFVFLLIIMIILKKDIVLICIVGLFTIGFIYSGSVLDGIQTIYKGVIVSGNEFWSIIVTISLIVSMSNALGDIGADLLMVQPFNRWIKNPSVAFWIMGLLMMVISFVLWPSPAVALIGAIVLPVAVKSGLPKIWAAVSMNLFGHGIALSGDYFIQGAPSITAKAAEIDDPTLLMKAGLPLWITMSLVTSVTAYIFMVRDLRKDESFSKEKFDKVVVHPNNYWIKFVAIFTPTLFLLNIFFMYRFELKGGDAAALLTGTAVLITIFCVVIKHDFKYFLSPLAAYIKNGFIFGIETFAPILVVGAFFFLGNEDTATQILGDEARGYLGDIGLYLSNKISLSKATVIGIQAITAGISGLGGAGFSALPLVGTIAETLSKVLPINLARLAALGQIIAMWVGGGTIIPWGVVAVAAICKVDPIDLVKKNLLPVFMGFFAMIIVSLFLV